MAYSDTATILLGILLLIRPCGPIHVVFTITGVSTTDWVAKAHTMLAPVPEKKDVDVEMVFRISCGEGTVGEKELEMYTSYQTSNLLLTVMLVEMFARIGGISSVVIVALHTYSPPCDVRSGLKVRFRVLLAPDTVLISVV